MKKDLVLFINAIRPATFPALRAHYRDTGEMLKPIVLVDEKIDASISERNSQNNLKEDCIKIRADFNSAHSIRTALKPYEDRIIAVTAQYENSVYELKKIIPYLPYLSVPTESSLEWSTEKKIMRQLLEAYNQRLVPKYKEVSDYSYETLNQIEAEISYPLIVKPSGLEGSLLVSLVGNRQELQNTLRHTFGEIQKAYNVWIKRQKPLVLVEEFMKGEMYSIDTYVAKDGSCYHTPPVKVVTGREVGFDDFFGYVRLLPSDLKEQEVKDAFFTAEESCKALGLRALTAHIELMKTKDGWKVIELGPRVGGYRHDLYLMGYGINHLVNDILNRADRKPTISTELRSHSALFNLYAHKEGTLKSINGMEEIEKLASFVWLREVVHPGEQALFAKNNGDPVLEVFLSHKNQRQLEEDINYMEKHIQINILQPHEAKRQVVKVH